MEVKKSKKANLETKRTTWLLVGFIMVLACMFVTFEWNQRGLKINYDVTDYDDIFVDIMIPITMPEQPAPPEPPETTAEEVITMIDDTSDMEETGANSTEFFENLAVEVKELPVEVPVEVVDIIETLDWVEIMPQFPGGQNELMKFLNSNIKYPAASIERGTYGKVIVQFVVDKDGSIVDPVIAKSVDPYLDREALRVINSMPKWKPGMQGGKTVRVKYTVPVVFKLQ